MGKTTFNALLISGLALCCTAFAQEAGIYKGPGIYYGKEYVEIAPDTGYRLSGEFRAADEGPEPSILLGVALFDENRQMIAHPFVADVAGTLTELVKPAEAGAEELKVKDASKWRKSFAHYVKVAFNAKEDFSDLPNRDITPGYISKVVQDGE